MKALKTGVSSIQNALRLLWKVSPFYLCLTLLLSGVMGLFTPLSLWVWQNLIDSVTHSIDKAALEPSVVLYLAMSGGVSLLTVLIDRANQYVSRIFANTVEYKTTERILQSVVDYSMEQYDDPETYNKIDMAIRETPSRCLDILDTIAQVITSLFQILGCAAILTSFGSIILLLSLISAIPLFLADYLNNRYWFKTVTGRLEKNRLITYLKELLIKNENIKELKLFQNSRALIKKITDMYNSFLASDRKARKKYAFRAASVSGFNILVHFFVNVVIVFQSVAHRTTIGQVTMQISSAESFRSSLNLLIGEISTMHDHSLYMQAISELESSSKVSYTECLPMPASFQSIIFHNVSFVYPGTSQPVLKNINLTLRSNSSYAIVGLNGSGKTTLLKLLLKMYRPTSGYITLDGINIEQIDTETYYQTISAVFQDFIHFPFSVRENITGVLDGIPDSSVAEAASLSSADRFICRLPHGYDTTLMREWNDGTELSLGQWQMIAIARCFCRNASIYILDEPFSALDPLAEIEVIKNVARKKENKMCLFITHRMTSIVLADEIIVLETGELKGMGTHAQLVKTCPLYQQLYNAQADAVEALNHSK